VGVRPSASAWIDVSVASHGGRAKRSGIRLHRCATLADDELTEHRGIRVTTVERTLLDIAGTIARPALERALERAEILRVLDARALQATIDAHPRHRGCAKLVAALELYRDDEMTRSDLEAFFRDLCARNDLPRPRVNAILDGEEVDFFWPREGLVIETDGRETHLTRAAFERDRAKDAALTLAGYRVVRFTHRQIEHDRHATAQTVIALLRPSGPSRQARHSV
jgi:very-short-patch-repair endonuclease